MTLSLDSEANDFKKDGEIKRKDSKYPLRESCSTEHRKYSAKQKKESKEEKQKKEEDKVLSMINQIQDIKIEGGVKRVEAIGSPLRKPTRV